MPYRAISQVIAGKTPLTTAATTPIADVAILLARHRVTAVLIVEKGRLTGLCSERDIVFRGVAQGLDLQHTQVAEIMTSKLETIGPDKPFGHALHLMYEGGFRHMPVIDAQGRPLGLVCAHDALDCDGLQLEADLERREEITVIL